MISLNLKPCPICKQPVNIETKSEKGLPNSYIKFRYVIKCKKCRLTLESDEETSRNPHADSIQGILKYQMSEKWNRFCT